MKCKYIKRSFGITPKNYSTDHEYFKTLAEERQAKRNKFHENRVSENFADKDTYISTYL